MASYPSVSSPSNAYHEELGQRLEELIFLLERTFLGNSSLVRASRFESTRRQGSAPCISTEFMFDFF
jgi:hypothetical protein